jgi:hypothetical protein
MANSGQIEYGIPKDSLKELYSYREEIDTAKNLIEAAIKKKITDCKCTVAILAMIAVIAAGGGATVIVTSGGPTAHALSFYGGVALTTVSAGMVIWMVIVIAKAYRFKNKEDERFTRLSTDLVGNQGILDAMRERQVNKEQIQAVVNKMRAAHFAQFVTLATQAIFPEGREEALSPQEQAILSSIAEHVDFVKVGENQVPLIPLAQQSLILENIRQDEANAVVERMGLDLFNAHVQAAIVSEYPRTLAAIAQNDKLLQTGVGDQRLAMQKMTPDQANAFVAKMGAEQYQALAGNVLTAYYGEEAAPANQTVLNALATSAHTSLLTPQQQRILMEHMGEDNANAIVGRLNGDQFRALATDVTNAYFGEAAVEANQTVLNALATSAHTSSLTPQQQRILMEQTGENGAVAIVRCLDGDRFRALAAEVTNTYFPAEGGGAPVNHVLEALYEQGDLLTPEQNYAFFNFFDLETARAAIQIISPENYNRLVVYAYTQPENRRVLTALAQRPADFARLVANEALSIEAICQTVALMNYAQKTDFIRVLTERALEIRRSPEHQDEYKKIEEVVWKTFEGALTLEFADLFSGGAVDPNAQALVQQFARWPSLTAQAIWIGPKGILQKAGFINVLWNAMGEDGKTLAVSTLADFYFRCKYSSDAERTVKQAQHLILVEYWYIRQARSEIEMPELLKRAFDKIYFDLARRNQGLSYDQFRSLVTDNEEISKDPAVRHRFALELLERMDYKEAKRLINQIDDYKYGHERYASMFKILVKEAIFLPKRGSEETDTRIPDRRKTLYFLFNSSKHKEKIFGELNTEFPEGTDWVNFSQLARDMSK